jgi:hypothetical protein
MGEESPCLSSVHQDRTVWDDADRTKWDDLSYPPIILLHQFLGTFLIQDSLHQFLGTFLIQDSLHQFLGTFLIQDSLHQFLGTFPNPCVPVFSKNLKVRTSF